MDKLRNALLYLVFFCVAFAAGFVVFDRFIMNLFVRHGQSKPIPELVGESYDVAEEKARTLGFKIKEIHAEHHKSIPFGNVISQIPKAGSLAKRGRTIKIIKSLGYEMAEVPDITGMTTREARIALSAAKLKIGKIDEHYSEEFERDDVIQVVPAPGESLLTESEVNLVVSLGSRTSEISVPNFIGMEIEDIENLRKELDINIVFKYRRINSIRENTVYQQSIEPGTLIPRNSVITLTVSQGVE